MCKVCSHTYIDYCLICEQDLEFQNCLEYDQLKTFIPTEGMAQFSPVNPDNMGLTPFTFQPDSVLVHKRANSTMIAPFGDISQETSWSYGSITFKIY